MNSKYKINLLIACLCVFMGFSQKQKIKNANKDYEKLAFIDANDIYLDVAEKGYRSPELLKRLGNTFYFNAKYKEANQWYKELVEGENMTFEDVYLLRYAQTLRAVGENDKAKVFYDKYLEKSGTKSGDFNSTEDYLNIIDENSGRYQVEPFAENTSGIDFGGGFYNDKLYFASTRDTGSITKRTSAWDGLPFLDLYEYSASEGSVKKVPGSINTRFHENSACITRDGLTMYFTRTNTTPRFKEDKDALKELKIYRAHLVDGKWTNVEDLSINGDNYSTAHPALSPDEKTLYFASNRPEAIGATDIFKASLSPTGELGVVENLGETVNTRGRESFPFITDRNELYFSSDGHFGLGGYDVFYTHITTNGFTPLINVGKPVNSDADDFAFTINTISKKGFFSSNREGGKGYDDIYTFVETKDIQELFLITAQGHVYDKETNALIPNATVALLDAELNVVQQVNTDASGAYEMRMDKRQANVLRASKTNYDAEETLVDSSVENITNDFYLQKSGFDVLDGDDLAKMLGINNIYFDFDDSKIRSDASVELEKIVSVLNKYPQLKVDVRAHTDSRGDDNYNLSLSDRRAKATVNYILSRGISSSRITGSGYGESQPLNNCGNGSNCTEAEYQLNRRSEFIVSKAE
ncbi:OmpA family protein [Joostella sp. CR20]|uniref:OmpA family protein n=1 Tax=Joostella sp. CR20 TaxID=2804312 RepID=UPI00313CA827